MLKKQETSSAVGAAGEANTAMVRVQPTMAKSSNGKTDLSELALLLKADGKSLSSQEAEAKLIAAKLRSVHLHYEAAARDRAARVKQLRRAMQPWERQWNQRKNSLARLVGYRRVHRLHAGEQAAWIIILANLVSLRDRRVTPERIQDLAVTIGLSSLEHASVEGVVGEVSGARRKLLDKRQTGTLLELTAAERADCGIRDIDATDEPAKDREQRLDRERKAKNRAEGAAKAAPRAAPLARRKPWIAMNMSRATFYRQGLHKDAPL